MPDRSIIDIADELIALPEYASVQRVRSHAQNYYVFVRNAEDLTAALVYHSDREHALDLWHVANRPKLRAFQREVGRLLHNFVSAASSLIDTTRVLFKRYGDARFPDYQPRIVSDFVSDPLARFIVCLRQYALHYAAPPLGSTLSMEQGKGMTNLITLPTELLLEFSSWDAPSKRYIADSGKAVVLDTAVNAYFEKVRVFYDWFYRRLNEINAPDIAIVAAKQDHLRQAHYANASMFLESGLSIYARGVGSPDEILRTAMAPDDYSRITEIRDRTEQLEEALNRIREFTQLDPDLVARLRTAYVPVKPAVGGEEAR